MKKETGALHQAFLTENSPPGNHLPLFSGCLHSSKSGLPIPPCISSPSSALPPHHGQETTSRFLLPAAPFSCRVPVHLPEYTVTCGRSSHTPAPAPHRARITMKYGTPPVRSGESKAETSAFAALNTASPAVQPARWNKRVHLHLAQLIKLAVPERRPALHVTKPAPPHCMATTFMKYFINTVTRHLRTFC